MFTALLFVALLCPSTNEVEQVKHEWRSVNYTRVWHRPENTFTDTFLRNDGVTVKCFHDGGSRYDFCLYIITGRGINRAFVYDHTPPWDGIPVPIQQYGPPRKR